MIDFPPRSVSIHTSTAPSHGRMWGRALFNSGGTCGSVRDAPLSDGCCLRHFPSCSPQSGGGPLCRPISLRSTGWARCSGALGLGTGARGRRWQHLLHRKEAGVFLSLLLSSLLQVGAKGSPGLLLTAAGSWSKETLQGSHQTVQGAPRENQANKKTPLYYMNPNF